MGDAPTPLYAQFDGDEVDGKRYKLGEPLADNVNAGTRLYLNNEGRFTSTKPLSTFAAPVASDKPVGDMTRDELVETILAAGADRLNGIPEDELRDLVERDRAREAGEQADDEGGEQMEPVKPVEMTGGGGDTSGETETSNAEYEALKDKPLGQMKMAELEIVAKAEGVDLTDADTNPKRVAAIQSKRDAPAA